VCLLVLLIVFIMSQGIMGAATPMIDRGESDGYRVAALLVKQYVPPGSVVAISDNIGLPFAYYVGLYNINITMVLLLVPTVLFAPPQKTSAPTTLNALGLRVRQIVPAQLFDLGPAYIVLDWGTLNWVFNETVRSLIFEHYVQVFVANPPIGYDYYWAGHYDQTAGNAVIILQNKDLG